MHIGRVVGTLVATTRVDNLEGVRFLVVQPLTTELKPKGKQLIAVDSVSAGPGDIIYYVRGREAANLLGEKFNPADAGIIGIVDRVDI
ncbi:MAG: EutN/CcmL family microcompartment protein [bacterium]|jgi:ethanolamine utilization protein EutN